MVFTVAVIGFTLAGCAAPGATRLERAPKAMPPSLTYLTADVLGFTLVDTSVDGSMRDALYDEVGIDATDAKPWIGDHAGVAIRQLPSPSEHVADDRIWFADVRDRDALEEALPTLSEGGRAVKAYDDGVLVARSKAGLDAFVKAADAYAVPDRKAMREYAAEAATKAPFAAVFRFDLIRTQARRPFQDDPALLEFARWATDSDDLIATRDGWVGVAGTSEDGGRATVVGNVEWVPDLSPDVDWGHATSKQLDSISIAADSIVAVDGIGQHLSAIVTGITRRNGQYATAQDVPKDEHPIDLEGVLDQFDGPSTVAWNRRELELVVDGAGDSVEDVRAALRLAGVTARATSTDQGTLDVVVPLGPLADRDFALTSRRSTLAARAGTPPRPPIAWLWSRSIAGCTGPAAGWITFDGEGEMTLSATVSLRDSSTAACGRSFASALAL